jgi:hypothetical protein
MWQDWCIYISSTTRKSVMLNQQTFFIVDLLSVMSRKSQNSSNFSLLHLSSFSLTLFICFSCRNDIRILKPLADKNLNKGKSVKENTTNTNKQNPSIILYDIVLHLVLFGIIILPHCHAIQNQKTSIYYSWPELPAKDKKRVIWCNMNLTCKFHNPNITGK